MIQTNNENILLRPCANCHCFGHPNPEELWKICPNMSETLPRQLFYMEDTTVEIEPRWLSNNAASYQEKSIFRQFHEHLDISWLINHLRYENITKEEYLMETILEYYLCITDLMVSQTDIRARLSTLKKLEYAFLYSAMRFSPDISLAAVGELPEHISQEYYNAYMRYTSNPFIWFYINVQGVLFSKDINQLIFLLPDIPELTPLKPKLQAENLVKLLKAKSEQDLGKLQKFQWTNPLSGCVWDFTKNPVIHSRDDSLAKVSLAEAELIINSLPKNFASMRCDLVFKCFFGSHSFYKTHNPLTHLLPPIIPTMLLSSPGTVD